MVPPSASDLRSHLPSRSGDQEAVLDGPVSGDLGQVAALS